MTTALAVDLLLLLLLLGAGVAGWQRGGLRLAGSVVGLLVGLALGLTLVPPLTAPVTSTVGWLLTIGGVLVLAAFGAGVGRWLGGQLAGLLARVHLSVLDRAAGAVGGVLLGFVLIGGTLALLPTGAGSGPAADWLSTARTSQLGSTATDAADRALQLVRVQVPGLADVRLPPGGAR